MNTRPDPTLPRCPGCGARHLPGWTANGPTWCKGIPARAFGPVVKVLPVPDFFPAEGVK